MTDELEKTEKQTITEVFDFEEKKREGGVPVVQQLLLVSVIFLLIFGTTLTPRVFSKLTKEEPKPPNVENYTKQVSEQKTSQPKEVPYDDLQVVAKAAYVWDVSAQRALFKKNETESLPLASVTKLMTALLANEILSKDSGVSISDAALHQDGDSGLMRDEVFKRQTLTDLVLMSSSNDGAFALAVAAGNKLNQGDDAAGSFVKAMNVRAEELGLTGTTYRNPTGLDINKNEAGAFGSAKDMAFLMEYIINNSPDILTYTQEDNARVYSESGIYHDANNTNYYIDKIPGLIGSKTGYTDLAGGNLVIAYDAGLNRPIIISVLGSTQQSRFTDVLKLIEETNAYLAQD